MYVSKPILRGGCIMKTYITTNLVHHLKTKHGEQYGEYQKTLELREENKGKGKPTPKQLSLLEASE